MIPRFFYKYQKYFIEEDIKKNKKHKINYAKRIISENELYYPLRSELNDPFEFRFCIYKNSKLIKGAGGEKLEEYEKKIFDEFGILSLTTKKDDIIMFSHYAGEHTGICIEFDSSKDEIFRKAFKVKYMKPLPSFELFSFLNEIDKTKYIKPIFSTKHKDWKYEKEWRVLYKISKNNDPRVERYNPEALTGIIFGFNASDLVKKEINDLIKTRKHKINLYQSIPRNNEYGLDIILLE